MNGLPVIKRDLFQGHRVLTHGLILSTEVSQRYEFAGVAVDVGDVVEGPLGLLCFVGEAVENRARRTKYSRWRFSPPGSATRRWRRCTAYSSRRASIESMVSQWRAGAGAEDLTANCPRRSALGPDQSGRQQCRTDQRPISVRPPTRSHGRGGSPPGRPRVRPRGPAPEDDGRRVFAELILQEAEAVRGSRARI